MSFKALHHLTLKVFLDSLLNSAHHRVTSLASKNYSPFAEYALCFPIPQLFSICVLRPEFPNNTPTGVQPIQSECDKMYVKGKKTNNSKLYRKYDFN